MRRVGRWAAFGFVCGIGGLAGWDASAAPGTRGRGDFGGRGAVGQGSFDAGGFGRAGGVLAPRGSGGRFRSVSGQRRFGGGFGRFDGGRLKRGGPRHNGILGAGFWPGELYGYGGAQPGVVIEPNIGQGGYGHPTVLDLPVVPGIRRAPPAEPVVYVINPERERPTNLRKGFERPGAKILSRQADGGYAAVADGDPEPRSAGPRVIHIRVPQGR